MTSLRYSSTLLLNNVADAIIKKVFECRSGVQYGDNQFLSDLMFAYESAIFVETDASVMDMISSIVGAAELCIPRLEGEKAKVTTKDGSKANACLAEVQLEQIQELHYLGSLVDKKKVAPAPKINSRIGKASTAFASLKRCD